VTHLEGYEQVVEEPRTPKEDIDEDSRHEKFSREEVRFSLLNLLWSQSAVTAGSLADGDFVKGCLLKLDLMRNARI
jgi:hypothetical protein